MAKTDSLIKERSKHIFLQRDLMKEHKELKEANNQEYSTVLGQIDMLEASNKKLKAANSELVKENYLMEEEKEELLTINEKLKKKAKGK